MMFHSSLVFEEVGIHLAENTMFFAGCFLAMIIRSEGQEEIVSLFYFENYFCPFWRCESVELYPHNSLIDELCYVSLESGDVFVFLPTKIRMSDRDNSAHISDDAARLFSGWFVFWYFDRAYWISSFTLETFIEKSHTIWITSFLITISHFNSSWSAIHVTREVGIVEPSRIVSFRNSPLCESFVTERISLFDKSLHLLTNFLGFSGASFLEHGMCLLTKCRRIRRHMKSYLAETSEKMRRNLTRRSRLNTSRTKVICESCIHEVMIGKCRKFDPRRYEIFENLFWSVTPIRECGMEMEVGFHKDKFKKYFCCSGSCKT